MGQTGDDLTSDTDSYQPEPSQSSLAMLSLEDMVVLYQLSQTIFTLHDLNLADYLHEQGAQTVSALSLALSTDTTTLTTLLEVATTLKLL